MAVKKAPRHARATFQKFAQQTLKSKEQQKQVTPVGEKGKKAVVIAQEIKFARLLSSNDKKTRDRVLKNLRKWLSVRGQSSFAFTEADFMRLWKGLFYCMWMSDKSLIQEELAESLSKIVHCFKTKDIVLLYTACALRTLGIEWYGIDQYRLDKFCMLVRRILRQTFVKCKEKSWDIEWIKDISLLLEKLLTDPKTCLGFSMHVTEVFLEELSKISNGNIPADVVTEFVKPFIAYFVPMDDERRIRHVMTHIFRNLIFQSDIGMDYIEKFHAWRDAGFPAGSIDAMEKIELSDEEMDNNDIGDEEHSLQNHIKCDTEKALDPRAGKVDVKLPQIPFNAKQIATLLDQYKFDPSATTKSRRQLRRLVKEFTELSEGTMPLGVKEIRLPKTAKKDTDTKLAAKRLLEFEKILYSDTPGNKRKRKKNGQLVQEYDDDDVKEDSEDADLENISNENNSDNSTIEIDEGEIPKKMRKVKRKINDIDDLLDSNAKTSSENSINLKKKEYKIKKNRHQGNCEIEVKNSKGKLKKGSSVLANGISESKKIKLKKNRTIATKVLDIITPVKKKKLPKLNTGKWDVSDSVKLVTTASLSNDITVSSTKLTNKSITNHHVEKNSILNKQVSWLAPALKKFKNEKNKVSVSSSEQQNKINIESSKKRVKIALQRNTAQHTSEYMLQIRKSPAIPFDANKKPLAGVLKASPIPSPINPFYKRGIL